MIELELQGRIAVVTGASRRIGIGAAIARALAEAGASVFLTYYRPYDAIMPWGQDGDGPEALLADLHKLGIRADGMELDLSQPEAPHTLFEAVNSILGPVDILVNNATYSTTDGIAALTAEELDRHYAVNVRGMALLCAEFVHRWRSRREEQQRGRHGSWQDAGRHGGRIINLTSGQSLGPMPGELAYVATKGAVDAFTVSLSAEVAPLGITVNAVDPGATDTGWMTPDFKAVLAAQAPQGRVGLPEDAARLVRFLASDEAGWITGQILHSRGGT